MNITLSGAWGFLGELVGDIVSTPFGCNRRDKAESRDSDGVDGDDDSDEISDSEWSDTGDTDEIDSGDSAEQVGGDDSTVEDTEETGSPDDTGTSEGEEVCDLDIYSEAPAPHSFSGVAKKMKAGVWAHDGYVYLASDEELDIVDPSDWSLVDILSVDSDWHGLAFPQGGTLLLGLHEGNSKKCQLEQIDPLTGEKVDDNNLESELEEYGLDVSDPDFGAKAMAFNDDEDILYIVCDGTNTIYAIQLGWSDGEIDVGSAEIVGSFHPEDGWGETGLQLSGLTYVHGEKGNYLKVLYEGDKDGDDQGQKLYVDVGSDGLSFEVTDGIYLAGHNQEDIIVNPDDECNDCTVSGGDEESLDCYGE